MLFCCLVINTFSWWLNRFVDEDFLCRVHRSVVLPIIRPQEILHERVTLLLLPHIWRRGKETVRRRTVHNAIRLCRKSVSEEVQTSRADRPQITWLLLRLRMLLWWRLLRLRQLRRILYLLFVRLHIDCWFGSGLLAQGSVRTERLCACDHIAESGAVLAPYRFGRRHT